MIFIYYCPICGQGTDEPIVSNPQHPTSPIHRCRKKVADGIDAAGKSEEYPPANRTISERLKDGFAMLRGRKD